MRPAYPAQRYWLCRRRIFVVNLPHGQEIQGSLGVRGLLLRSILRLVRLNGLSVVGISEGAELLPMLAPEVPQLAGLLLIFFIGLDPVQALQFQAHRLGADADWRALDRAQAGGDADSGVRQGRSLRYWRDLWRWPLEQPLLKTSWPPLQV